MLGFGYRLQIKNPIVVLMLLMPYATIAVLILSSALPLIAQHFAVASTLAAYVITLAMLGYTIGPILYGPLAKRYSQKTTLFIGLVLSLCGIGLNILAYQEHYFYFLLIGQFITSLGAVAGMVIAYALVADYYPEIKAKQILSKLIIWAFAIMPALSIAVGGYLSANTTWWYCFYFLLIYACICLGLVALLVIKPRASLLYEKQFKLKPTNYRNLLTNKKFMRYIAVTGLVVAVIYIYMQKVPLIAATQLSLTPFYFAVYSFLPYLGYIVALWFSTKYKTSLSYNKIILFGCAMLSVGSGLILIASLTNHLTAQLVFLGAFLNFAGAAPIIPHTLVLALQGVSDRTYAAAFASCLYMIVATLLTWLVSLVNLLPSLTYALAMLLLVIGMLLTHQRKC